MDSWDDRSSAAERAELDEHLAGCGACRREADGLTSIWQRLGELESGIAVPSERLRSRFYAFLAAEESRRARRGWRGAARSLAAVWPSRPAGQLALVAATLVLGVGLGVILAWRGAGAELRALRLEMASLSGDAGLSLLSHPAASERLRGVGLADRAADDERVVTALLEVVQSDPSVNVRLAAIEALAPRLERPGVKPQLLRTLPSQRSPLLQMTLLDVLLPSDGALVLEAAEPLLDDVNLDTAVRQRLLAAKGDPA